jgi:hypothetical protein
MNDFAGTACVIRARDFSDKTTDPNRTTWTPAKLRHLIAALGDTPVIVTTDNQTGFTLVNVTLVGVREGFSHSYEVGIKSVFSDGTTSTVWHLTFKLGDTIVPLGGDNVKWRALRSWADEKSLAVELAQVEHGDAEGRSWGHWEATPGLYRVHVRYTPHTGNPHFADKWGTRGSWEYDFAAVERQGSIRLGRRQVVAGETRAERCERGDHEACLRGECEVAAEVTEVDPIDLQDAARGDFTPGA